MTRPSATGSLIQYWYSNQRTAPCVKPVTRRPVARSGSEKPRSRRCSQSSSRKPKSAALVIKKKEAFSPRPAHISPRASAGTASRKQ